MPIIDHEINSVAVAVSVAVNNHCRCSFAIMCCRWMNMNPSNDDPNKGNSNDSSHARIPSATNSDNAKFYLQFLRIQSLLSDEMQSTLKPGADPNALFKIATIILGKSKSDNTKVSCTAPAIAAFIESKTNFKLKERSLRDAVRKGNIGVTPLKQGRQKRPPRPPTRTATPRNADASSASENRLSISQISTPAPPRKRPAPRTSCFKSASSIKRQRNRASFPSDADGSQSQIEDNATPVAPDQDNSLVMAERVETVVPVQLDSNCRGIRCSLLAKDDGFKTWISKQLERLSNSLKEELDVCDLIDASFIVPDSTTTTSNHVIDILNESILKDQSLRLKFQANEGQQLLCLVSTGCSNLYSSGYSKSCLACTKAKGSFHSEVSRLMNYTPPKFNWNTTNNHLARTPRRALKSILSLKAMVRNREKKICRMIAVQRDKKNAIEADKKVSAAVRLAVDTARSGVQATYGEESAENTLFDALRNHLIKYGHDGPDKGKGIRFDPSLFQFAVAMCAKTSHSVYRQIARVMMLPSLEYVLRKQKDETEKQSGNCFGVRAKVISNIDTELKERQAARSARLGALSFDSMVIGRDGLCLDFHSGTFVGLDPTLPFDVMQRNFESMAAAAKEKASVEVNAEAVANAAGTEEEELSFSDPPATSMAAAAKEKASVEANAEAVSSDPPATAAAETEDQNAGLLLERLENVAKHHLIFKWSSVDPTEDISRVVASSNVAELKPGMIHSMLHSVLLCLHLNGLKTCVLVGDGAKENTKLFDTIGTESIGSYVPLALRQEFTAATSADFNLFDRKLVMLHPCTNEPIFILEDMPHVVKRVVNAMERSSLAPEQRDLRWDDNPMNLSVIRQLWELVGGKSTDLQATKFTSRHFFKDQNDRMRCSLSFQILSRSSYYLIKDVLNDEELRTPLESHQCKRLTELVDHGNTLTDACNGRKKYYPVEEGSLYPTTTDSSLRSAALRSKRSERENFTSDTGIGIQQRFLGILDWICQWKLFVQRDPSPPELESFRITAHGEERTVPTSDEELRKQFRIQNKRHFFADATWNGLVRLSLGMVGVIEHYAKGKGYVIAPRRLSSDPCEQHFCETRQSMGAQSGGTALQCNAIDNKQDSFAQASAAYSKGNCAAAPSLFKAQKNY